MKKKDTLKLDNINPNHYKSWGMECIEAIQAMLTPEEFKGYCKWNNLKYLWREKNKNWLEDLKKANRYLEYLIKKK